MNFALYYPIPTSSNLPQMGHARLMLFSVTTKLPLIWVEPLLDKHENFK